MKKGLLNLSKEEFEATLAEMQILKFRANQIYSWIYKFGKNSFTEMTNIGAMLRQTLNEKFYIYRPEITEVLKSSDRTIKFLLKLEDFNTIETVFIPTEKRYTICVSSQVGCAVNCHFCNTGYNGFVRNLTTEEIIGQYMIVRDYLELWPPKESKISNIVFMGMGEPLYNTLNVLKSIDSLIDEDFDGVSRRKITLSTSGIAPVLSEIAPNLKCRLAISLHAPNDNIRNQIMPINNLYNIEKIMKACKIYYTYHPFMKITFEYLLLDGINDTTECAFQLLNLIKNLNSKVNLIQFNSWNGCSFKPSTHKNTLAFGNILEKAGIEAPIRQKRGQDIMAACGQLQIQKY